MRASRPQVYGDPASVPVKEDFPVSATNPYGRTKLFIEQIMRDLYKSDTAWNIVLLRYFNPVGASRPVTERERERERRCGSGAMVAGRPRAASAAAGTLELRAAVVGTQVRTRAA